MMPRTAVTGGAGFIGRWAVKTLVDRGLDVTVLDVVDRPAWLPAHVQYVQGSVSDADAITAALQDASSVCHLAFLMDIDGEDPVAVARVNVLGTSLVMQGALRAGVNRVVWASSVMVYGPLNRYPPAAVSEDAEPMPRTHYGATKLALEWTARAFRDKGLEAVGLRFTTVFGPGRTRAGAAPFAVTLFESVARGCAIRLPHGDRRAAMLYAPDAGLACTQAILATGALRDVYNVNGFETSVRDLADEVVRQRPEAKVAVEAGGTSPWPTSIDCRAAERDLNFVPHFNRDRSVADYLHSLYQPSSIRATP